jgi:uncharacterized coiled-coil protein SlyX
MQANGLPTYSELEAEIERQRRIIDGGIDAASAHGMQILDLQRRIIEQNATIARQAAQLEQYAKILDDERAEIAQLRAQLATVPVESLRRYFDCISYDGGKSFHSIPLEYDELQINMWFESLEDAA